MLKNSRVHCSVCFLSILSLCFTTKQKFDTSDLEREDFPRSLEFHLDHCVDFEKGFKLSLWYLFAVNMEPRTNFLRHNAIFFRRI